MPTKPIRLSGYLTFTERRIVKVTKSFPDLGYNERAIRVDIEVPGDYFERSTPRVEIELSEEVITAPTVVVVPPNHPLAPESR